MSRLAWHNALLGLAALALAALLWLDRPPPPERPPPLTGLAPGDIDRIELRGEAEALAIVLLRRDGQWALARPIRAPAAEKAIDRLLSLATQPAGTRYGASDLPPDVTGLAAPLWTLRVNDIRIEIGAQEPISGRRYARVGEKITLIQDVDPALLDPNYADLVARDLLPGPSSVTAIRTADYMLDEAGLRESWEAARALWVIRPDARDYAAAGPRIEVLRGDARVEFLLRRREPRLELLRPDWDLLYVLPGSAAGELLPDTAE